MGKKLRQLIDLHQSVTLSCQSRTGQENSEHSLREGSISSLLSDTLALHLFLGANQTVDGKADCKMKPIHVITSYFGAQKPSLNILLENVPVDDYQY